MKKPPLDFTLYFSGLLLLILSLSALLMTLARWENLLAIRFILLGLLINTVFLMYRFYTLKRQSDTTLFEFQKLKYIEEEIHLYRQYRHDHKNHMIVLNELAETARLNEIKLYTKGLIDQDNSAHFDFSTGVLELDVLLYAKLQRARDMGIDMRFNIQCSLQTHAKNIIDIVSILSNVIDNAQQATLAIDVPKERMMQLTINETPLSCEMTLTNSFSPTHPIAIQKIFDRGYSTKKDQGNQGLGLTIVRKLVKKLGGNISLNVYNGIFFQLKISLPKHLLR